MKNLLGGAMDGSKIPYLRKVKGYKHKSFSMNIDAFHVQIALFDTLVGMFQCIKLLYHENFIRWGKAWVKNDQKYHIYVR